MKSNQSDSTMNWHQLVALNQLEKMQYSSGSSWKHGAEACKEAIDANE